MVWRVVILANAVEVAPKKAMMIEDFMAVRREKKKY